MDDHGGQTRVTYQGSSGQKHGRCLPVQNSRPYREAWAGPAEPRRSSPHGRTPRRTELPDPKHVAKRRGSDPAESCLALRGRPLHRRHRRQQVSPPLPVPTSLSLTGSAASSH